MPKIKIKQEIEMSETPQPNPQLQQDQAYVEHHPDAVTDPAKAEIMAYASKEAEETVVKERQAALGHAALVGEEGYNNNGYLARQAAERARNARLQADTQAREAGAIYDSVKRPSVALRTDEIDSSGLITDPAKAEAMAYASKAAETLAVEEGNTAIAHAARVGEAGYNSNGYLGRQAAERAEKARAKADTQAREAGAIYDSVKNL